MPAEPPIEDDPILRRVAAARPSIPEDDLSPASPRARALAERILADAPPPQPARGRWRRPRAWWTVPRIALVLAPVAAVVAVLFLAGTFSGPDDSGTQPAAAAVIRAAVRALGAMPGTISVEVQTYVAGPSVHGHPWTLRSVLETPSGRGPQNNLLASDNPVQFGGAGKPLVAATSYVGGTEAYYSPTTHTIYESSIWGPYLHPGRRPGTYVYRYAPGATVPTSHPVDVTATERRALLRGEDAVMETGRTIHGKYYFEGLKVRPVLRAPAAQAQTLRQELMNRNLHVVGRTTVDGRAAIEIQGRTTDGTAPELRVYFDARTDLPFEEVYSVGTKRQTTIRLSLQTLKITRANQRLLSLQALYPTARVDRNHRDYVRNARVSVYNQ